MPTINFALGDANNVILDLEGRRGVLVEHHNQDRRERAIEELIPNPFEPIAEEIKLSNEGRYAIDRIVKAGPLYKVLKFEPVYEKWAKGVQRELVPLILEGQEHKSNNDLRAAVRDRKAAEAWAPIRGKIQPAFEGGFSHIAEELFRASKFIEDALTATPQSDSERIVFELRAGQVREKALAHQGGRWTFAENLAKRGAVAALAALGDDPALEEIVTPHEMRLARRLLLQNLGDGGQAALRWLEDMQRLMILAGHHADGLVSAILRGTGIIFDGATPIQRNRAEKYVELAIEQANLPPAEDE